MLGREPTAIPFSTEAMRASLLRLQNEWETVSNHPEPDCDLWISNRRFRTVMAWAQEGRAVNRAHRALHLRGHSSVREPEPFAAVILCTADRGKGR